MVSKLVGLRLFLKAVRLDERLKLWPHISAARVRFLAPASQLVCGHQVLLAGVSPGTEMLAILYPQICLYVGTSVFACNFLIYTSLLIFVMDIPWITCVQTTSTLTTW